MCGHRGRRRRRLRPDLSVRMRGMPMLRQAEDSLRQPQRTPPPLVVLMLLPLPRLLLIQSARTALNRLPSPCLRTFLPSLLSLSSLCLHRPVTQSCCSARRGSCCRAAPFFNLSNVLLLLLCLLLRMSSPLAAFLPPRSLPSRLAQARRKRRRSQS